MSSISHLVSNDTHIAVFQLSSLRCLVAHCVRKIRGQGKPHSHFICEWPGNEARDRVCHRDCIGHGCKMKSVSGLGMRLGTGCATGWCSFNWKGSKVRHLFNRE